MKKPKVKKLDKIFQFKLDEQTELKLELLAKDMKKSKSKVLRILILNTPVQLKLI